MQPLTEKQIKKLRNAVKHWRWCKWVLPAGSVIFFFFIGLEIYYAWFVGINWGFSMEDTLSLTSRPIFDQFYSGAQVFSVNRIHNAIVLLYVAVVTLAQFIVGIFIYKRNEQLLYYIDKEQDHQQAINN